MTNWLLAFSVHSTLWLCLAWVWTRLRPRTHARLRETIWYTAIAASFITPTAQLFISPDSAIWRLDMPAALVSVSEPGHRTSESSKVTASARKERERHEPLRALGAPGVATKEHSHGTGVVWRSAVLWIWGTAAGVFVLVRFGRFELFRRWLGRRERIGDPRIERQLARLSRRAGLRRTPRLRESERLGSPIALGIGPRTEICVPTRALHELDRDQLHALLGHEVAHHLRRDVLRLGVLSILTTVFFFQPLFRTAARALHQAAEEQCDDWAAEQVEDRLAMASCLTEVAAWVVLHDRNFPVTCMARSRSQLRERIDRLIDEQGGLEPPAGAWRVLGATALLTLAAWLAPAVAPASEHPHEDPQRDHHAVGSQEGHA